MKSTSGRRSGLSRRSMLKTGAGAFGFAALGAPAIVERANAQSQFDWKRFKGEKLEVSLTKSPRADILQQYQKEFEELTGITVGSEQVPEQQHRQKLVIEFASGHPSFDVVTESWHVQKRLMGKGKWLEDLRPYLKDASLTAPDLDYADFGKAGIEYSTQADGRVDTMPLSIDYWILYWNKELFQAKGVAYPKTFDEMLKAAAALTDAKNGVYGFVSRGLKNANVPVWTSFLLGWGLETLDQNGKLLTDGPEAVAAAEIYKKLNKDYAPPGVAGFNWNECQTTFAQGKAAMWLDGVGFAAPLEDPSKSRIKGKIGYGVTPAGPKARHSAMFGDGIGMPANAKKKQQAWFYLQWATNRLNQGRMLMTGSGTSCRNAPYKDPAVTSNLAFPKEWLDTMLESAAIARPGLPVILPVTEFRDVLGVALTNMIGGADPAAELKKATEQFRPILEQSEKT